MSRYSALLLAAGKGKRMGSEVPKQFMPIHGKPLLYYPLRAFEESRVDEVVIVTGADDIARVSEEIVDKYGFQKVCCVTAGGRERHWSVYEGLQAVTGDRVLIHDGARALVTPRIIDRMCAALEQYPACVAAVPSKDTIKLSDAEGFISQTLNRKDTWVIQTPQAFDRKLVCDAYEKLAAAGDDDVTDDAMVVERYTDTRVRLIEADYRNIKITTAEDLEIAAAWLGKPAL